MDRKTQFDSKKHSPPVFFALSRKNCLAVLMMKLPRNHDRSRSIYQYSNMAPRLSGQTSIFGVVFFVSKSLSGIERQT